MVLFVGDKPSRYNTNPKVAFKGARCEKRLLEWLTRMYIEDYKLINRVDDNAHKIIADFVWHNRPIVALGKNASHELKCNGVSHYALPHPSGLNRQLNNKDYIDTELLKCGKYILNFGKDLPISNVGIFK